MKWYQQPEKWVLGLVLILFVSCAVNPLTGKRQLSLINASTINQLSATQYAQVKQTSRVLSPANNAKAAMVTRVGSKLSAAITRYYTDKGLARHLSGFAWEYTTIEDPTVNAWCMPGGKIAVYTGILQVTKNEDALAVVLGHEIAHAIAEHGKERMSQGLIQQFGGVALSIALLNKPAETQALFSTAYNVGTTVGAVLPWGRANELEADRLGLIYCALAGYNPEEAIPFWQRMSNVGGGQKPPEWLSTHPAEATRIAQLQKIMPEAVEIYRATTGKAPNPVPKKTTVAPDSWKGE
jgi:predicted Zn-dependent protease